MNTVSKVYIRIDYNARIVQIDGGYSIRNIQDFSDWIFVDEGTGDKYNLCQRNYLEDAIYEEHGIPNYKYENGKIVHRTAEEIQKDIEELSQEPMSSEDRIAELESMLDALVRGETE